jgi:hypothetical protein
MIARKWDRPCCKEHQSSFASLADVGYIAPPYPPETDMRSRP